MNKKKKTYTRYLKDPIINPYVIQLDDHGFVVHKTIVAEDSGKDYTQVVGYYNSLSNCLKGIAKNIVMNDNYDTIQSFIDKYETTIEKLNQAYKI